MLKSKNVVITGSTSGIGYQMAAAFAKSGHNIMLNGFIEEVELNNIKRDLEIFGTKIMFSPADMKKPEEIYQMIKQAQSELGSVDILINNAGIQHVSPVESFSSQAWDDVIAVNLSASFHSIKAALPIMREKKWGRIINISSAHGLVASKNKSAYVAAKHGIIGLTKSIAFETALENITCNAICPGWVLTPLVQKQVDAIATNKNISTQQAEFELLAEKQPSLKFVLAPQIAELAIFLCSEAAGQMRGSALSIDGGWTAQ
jgi:3-hydroxybutyrate dehydrogenase